MKVRTNQLVARPKSAEASVEKLHRLRFRLYKLAFLVVLMVALDSSVSRAATVYGVSTTRHTTVVSTNTTVVAAPRSAVVVAPAPRPVVVVAPAPRPVVVAPVPVVAPLPVGYIAVLPTGYQAVYVGGVRYYMVGGVRYQAQFYQGRTVYVRVHI